MKISTKGRYGLRAMIDIALNDTDGAMPLREIAEKQGLSEKYLEHIMTLLHKAGLVRGVRGPRGGYRLNKPCGEITTGMVLRAVEGSIAPTLCAGEGCCEKGEECAAAFVWHALKSAIDGVVDNITLEDLREKAKQ
ncbi:MAG: Rrf2 family transcriptional regulator [Clostridiales bacterium]|jgi:Rrf2 family protein|nr:Rrf2 family transcriptional regulator [Clostridiales bacterium]